MDFYPFGHVTEKNKRKEIVDKKGWNYIYQ